MLHDGLPSSVLVPLISIVKANHRDTDRCTVENPVAVDCAQKMSPSP